MNVLKRIHFPALVIFFLLVSGSLTAQRFSAGVNTETPNPNAVLHLVSPQGNQGLLLPSLTTTQRTTLGGSLTAADNGLMVFDSDVNAFFFWVNGTGWIATTNTDEQDLANVLGQNNDAGGVAIENVADPVNPQDVATKNYVDNLSVADNQDLTLAGNTLSLTNDPTSIDLSPFLDNTDNQNLSNVLAAGNDAGAITITNLPTPVNPADVATKSYVDNNGGNQSLTLTGSDLTIDNGNTIDLSGLGVAGDVTGNLSNAIVSNIGGQTAADVATATLIVNSNPNLDLDANDDLDLTAVPNAAGDISGDFATGLFVDFVGGSNAADVSTATTTVLSAPALDLDANDDLALTATPNTAGDISGDYASGLLVDFVGGEAAADIASATLTVLGAPALDLDANDDLALTTAPNAAGDISGDFSGGLFVDFVGGSNAADISSAVIVLGNPNLDLDSTNDLDLTTVPNGAGDVSGDFGGGLFVDFVGGQSAADIGTSTAIVIGNPNLDLDATDDLSLSTVPNAAGDISGDFASGLVIDPNSVTNAEIADGTIINADINAAAAIGWTKIDKTGANVSELANDAGYLGSGSNISTLTNDAGYLTAVTSADITDGEIVDADINAAAAIGWTKIDKTGANVSELANDAGYLGSGSNISTLTNDAGYLTAVTSTDITNGEIVDADINAAAAIGWTKIDKTGANVSDLSNDAGYITTELDPTVPANIKDGIDWTEVTSRPAGLDDGDDVGLTVVTSADITDGEIVNADINASAAIGWTKISKTGANVSELSNDAGYITTELDPTVPANIKDGIDWTELSGIPAGFSDGTDDGILTETQTLGSVVALGNDAGGSIITNVLDPVAAQDVATKNYVDTQGFITGESQTLGAVVALGNDAGGSIITNVLDPVAAQDVATKNYVDTQGFITGESQTLGAVVALGNDAGGSIIANVLDPVAAQDVATKNYVDTQGFITGESQTLGAVVALGNDAGGSIIANVLDPVAAQDVATKNYVDTQGFITGESQTLGAVVALGNDAGGSIITNVLDPVAAQDVATKNYVDTQGFITGESQTLGAVVALGNDAGGSIIANVLDPVAAQDVATKNYVDTQGFLTAEVDPVWVGDRTTLGSGGTINNGGNLIDWTQLKNVPATIADGSDDGITTVNANTTLTGDGAGSPLGVNVGVAANNIVQLNGIAQLPGVDGRNLTNLSRNTSLSDNAPADGQVLTWNNTNLWWEATTPPAPTLNNGLIFVGDGGNNAVGVSMSGDVTISNTGVTTIPNNAIVSAKIADDNVTLAKIQNGTANQVLGTDGTGNPVYIAQNTLAVGSATDLVAGGSVVSDAEVDNNITIDGGSIDNTVVGGTTAAAGTFTSLNAGAISGTSFTGNGSALTNMNTNTSLSFNATPADGDVLAWDNTNSRWDAIAPASPLNSGNGVTINTNNIDLGGALTATANITTNTGFNLVVDGINGEFITSTGTTSFNSSTINLGDAATDDIRVIGEFNFETGVNDLALIVNNQTNATPILRIPDLPSSDETLALQSDIVNVTGTANRIPKFNTTGDGLEDSNLVGNASNDQITVQSNATTLPDFIINDIGAGDASMQFDRGGIAFYSMGIDEGDNDDFKISSGTDVSSNELVIQRVSGNVGIGTPSPANRLDVEGGAVVGVTYSGNRVAPANGMLIEGNVGIGTDTPGATLDVAGGVFVSNNTATGSLNVDTDTNLNGNLISPADAIIYNASGGPNPLPGSITKRIIYIDYDADLNGLPAGQNGQELIIIARNVPGAFSLNSVGNVQLNGDTPFTPARVGANIHLVYDSVLALWLEISRSN